MFLLFYVLACASPAVPDQDSQGDEDCGGAALLSGSVASIVPQVDPAGGRLLARAQGEDTPVQAVLDESAAFSLSLSPGPWTLWAEDAAGSCISEEQAVELVACEELAAQLVISLCER